jgi:hypothetical protein
MQIMQSDKYLTFLFEQNSWFHVVPIDGRAHGNGIATWFGDSVGHWEGDTLVIDVTSQNDQTWFDRAGNFHSDSLHVVERYTPRSADTLNYEATIEDPKVFARPWKISMPLYRRVEKNAKLLEFRCAEFSEELLYGPLSKKPNN